VLAVAHDRDLLDNVAGWILMLAQGNGIPWEGIFSDYEVDRHRRLGADADHPHRIRDLPLVRG